MVALGLGLVLLGGPAWGGDRGKENPFRLNIRQGDYKLRLPAPAPAAAPGGRQGKGPGLAALIERHAKARGLDPALVHAVVRAESAYRPAAVSPKGAVGLMQVMPDTARRFGRFDLKDPAGNLAAGTAYLSYLLDLFGDLSLALAAYNAGEGAVLRHGRQVPPYAETRAYVAAILKRYGQPPAPGGSRPPRRSYVDGVRLDPGNLSPYLLRRDLWRTAPGPS